LRRNEAAGGRLGTRQDVMDDIACANDVSAEAKNSPTPASA
jgi:hypothetical protein